MKELLVAQEYIPPTRPNMIGNLNVTSTAVCHYALMSAARCLWEEYTPVPTRSLW